MKILKYILAVLFGWAFLLVLVYYYVIRQKDLISDVNLLIIVILSGTFISFIFSSLEAALIKLGHEEKKLLSNELTKFVSEFNQSKLNDEALHLKKQKQTMNVLDMYYEKEQLVAPLIIISNIMGVLVASFIPKALHNSSVNSPESSFGISFYQFKDFLGCNDCFLGLPWEGTESLTFFSSALLIIIFGKILPKRLGSHYTLWFLKKFGWLIAFVNIFAGWIGTAILALVELPMKLLNK